MRWLRRDPAIVMECFRPTKAGLGGRVVRGGAWFATLVVTRAALAVATTAVLARLLTPADFGYVGMAAVATDLAVMLCALGVPSIIVQAPRLTRLDLDSAFWFCTGIGVLATVLVVALSPLAASLFKEPALVPILCAMASILFLDEISAIHFAIANRLLLVRHEFVCQIAGLVVRAAVNVVLALADYGVWSLVWGSVAGRAAYSLFFWWLIPYVPRLRFRNRFLARNWRAGGSYAGCSALFYFSSNVDPTVVGRMFGVTQLGYYQTAFSLPEELRSRIAAATVRILFPAFAMLQTDHVAFRANVLRSLRIFAAIVLPMGAGMAVSAEPIVRLLYGSQWMPVVPLLRIAAIIGIVRALQAFVVNIYKAKGRPDLEFKIGAGTLPLLLIAVAVAIPYGPPGIAVGLLVFSVLSLVSTYPALRLIDLAPLDTLAALLPATMGAAFMSVVLVAVIASDALPHSSAALELGICIAIGAMSFLLMLFLLSRKTVEDFWAVVRVLRRGRTDTPAASLAPELTSTGVPPHAGNSRP